VPKDFRVSDFIKYNKLECSNPNLWSYYNKMDEMIYNDKMLIYFFQDSLIRSIMCWYMRLDNTRIKKWKELVESFLKQYKFNLEISFRKTNLMTIEKGNQGSVRVYVQRWRDDATHIQPPLIETEMVTLFANTFKSFYYEHFMGCSS